MVILSDFEAYERGAYVVLVLYGVLVLYYILIRGTRAPGEQSKLVERTHAVLKQTIICPQTDSTRRGGYTPPKPLDDQTTNWFTAKE